MRSGSLTKVAILVGLLGLGSTSLSAQEAPFDPLAQLEAESARVLGVLEAAQATKRALEEEDGGSEASVAAARENLAKHARALYRITRAGMLPLAGGVSAMLGHLARVDRLRRVVEREASEIASQGTRVAARRAELAEAESRVASAERALREIEARKASLSAERARAAELALAPSMPVAMPASGELRFAEGTIRLSPEPTRAARAVREEAPFTSLGSPVVGAAFTDDRADGSLLLQAQSGVSVRSAEEGRVVVAEQRSSYGRLVIIDHGDRFFTVYGGLDEFDVATGDVVSRGARIGTAGDRGVRFEVREGSRKLDARAFLR